MSVCEPWTASITVDIYVGIYTYLGQIASITVDTHVCIYIYLGQIAPACIMLYGDKRMHTGFICIFVLSLKLLTVSEDHDANSKHVASSPSNHDDV